METNKMKTYRQKKSEASSKLNHKVWKSLNIEKAVKAYGFNTVKYAITKWLTYQSDNAKLLKQKRELEEKLAEVSSKL